MYITDFYYYIEFFQFYTSQIHTTIRWPLVIWIYQYWPWSSNAYVVIKFSYSRWTRTTSESYCTSTSHRSLITAHKPNSQSATRGHYTSALPRSDWHRLSSHGHGGACSEPSLTASMDNDPSYESDWDSRLEDRWPPRLPTPLEELHEVMKMQFIHPAVIQHMWPRWTHKDIEQCSLKHKEISMLYIIKESRAILSPLLQYAGSSPAGMFSNIPIYVLTI